MAEVNQYVFAHKEVAEALIKQQGIHEGLWMIYIEFGLGAANVNTPPPDEGHLLPAALVPVKKIGIQRVAELNPLTVDAAQVNPRPAAARAARKSKK